MLRPFIALRQASEPFGEIAGQLKRLTELVIEQNKLDREMVKLMRETLALINRRLDNLESWAFGSNSGNSAPSDLGKVPGTE